MNISKSIILPIFFLSFSSIASNSYFIKLNNNLSKDVVFINKVEEIEPVLPDWIYTDGDTCGGMRQSSAHPSVYFARSKFSTLTTTQFIEGLPIPDGYHRATRSEYLELIPYGTGTEYIYMNQCGISGLPMIDNKMQIFFKFKDKYSISAGKIEGDYLIAGYAFSYFAGYVLVKD